jgi:hypothetical protein
MILVLFVFLELVWDMWPLLYPTLYYWIPVIGFGVMGLTFYVVFHRHNLMPVQFLNKDSRKLFFFSLLFIVITVLFFEIIYASLFFSWYYNTLDWQIYSNTMDFLGIATPLFRLLTYIAIIIIGLAFHRTLSRMFEPGHIRKQVKFSPRFMINIGLIVGAFACILQVIVFVMDVFWLPSGRDVREFPVIDLGTDYFLVTAYIPFWLGTLLIALYLVIILMVTMNSVPIHYQHLIIGKSMRMDIQSIFRFSLILIVFSSILRMLTGVILTWRWIWGREMGDEWLFDRPFHDVFIDNIYYLTKFLSPLLLYLGFAFVCLCFHHIFRAWQYTKLAEAGKPT